MFFFNKIANIAKGKTLLDSNGIVNWNMVGGESY